MKKLLLLTMVIGCLMCVAFMIAIWGDYQGPKLENVESMVSMIVVLVFLGIGILVYFIPSIVAGRRNHPNTTAIVVLNLFLGWSIIGWVIALIWAVKVKE